MADNFNNPQFTANLNVSSNNTVTDGCINVPPIGDDGSKNLFIATSVEQINSGKYVSVKNIAARLARNIKGKNFDIYDVAEWTLRS